MSARPPRRPAQPLRILLVDDDEGEYLLVRNLLSRFPGRAVALDWVTAASEALRTFRETGAHDVYLIDYRLLDHTGLDVVRDLRAQGCRAPLLMLTTCADDAVDRQAMRAGAADYLIKAEMTRALLQRSIRHALERAELTKQLRESEERYRSLARNFPRGCLLVIDRDGLIQLAEGTSFTQLLGEGQPDHSTFIGKTLPLVFEPELAEILLRDAGRALGGRPVTHEMQHRGRQWLVSATPQQRFDAPPQAVLMVKDITDVRDGGRDPARELALTRLWNAVDELATRGALPSELVEPVHALRALGSPAVEGPSALVTTPSVS